MVLEDNFFVFLSLFLFCFVVAIFDKVHNLDAIQCPMLTTYSM